MTTHSLNTQTAQIVANLLHYAGDIIKGRTHVLECSYFRPTLILEQEGKEPEAVPAPECSLHLVLSVAPDPDDLGKSDAEHLSERLKATRLELLEHQRKALKDRELPTGPIDEQIAALESEAGVDTPGDDQEPASMPRKIIDELSTSDVVLRPLEGSDPPTFAQVPTEGPVNTPNRLRRFVEAHGEPGVPYMMAQVRRTMLIPPEEGGEAAEEPQASPEPATA